MLRTMKAVGLIAFALSFSLTGHTDPVRFGLRGGVVKYEAYGELSGHGISIGMLADKQLSTLLSISGDFSFIRREVPSSVIATDGGDLPHRSYNPRQRMDYLSTGVSIRLYVNGDGFGPYLLTSPRVDFLLKVYSDFGGDLSEYYNNIVTGFDFGGGIALSGDKGLLTFLELRIHYDLRTLFKSGVDPNRSFFDITLGVMVF